MTDKNTNTRFTESRNKREGWYCGKVKGEHFRLLKAFEILEDDKPRGDWFGFDKRDLKTLLKNNLKKRISHERTSEL